MGKLADRLRDASRSGVYRAESAAPMAEAVAGTQLALATVDLAKPLFEAFAEALSFPRWFGANWDALEDCLGDLSWRAAQGHVILLEGWQVLPEEKRAVLIDVLASSAEFWRNESVPFFAVFVDPAGKLALPALFRAA